jgi:hypothetical protein
VKKRKNQRILLKNLIQKVKKSLKKEYQQNQKKMKKKKKTAYKNSKVK